MRAVRGTGRLIAGRYRLPERVARGATGIVRRGALLGRDRGTRPDAALSAAPPAGAATAASTGADNAVAGQPKFSYSDFSASDGGPVFWQPVKPGSAARGDRQAADAGAGSAGGPAAAGSPGESSAPGGPSAPADPSGPGGGGGTGSARFWQNVPPARRRRLVGACGGIVALAIAAAVGLSSTPHAPAPQARQHAAPGVAVPGTGTSRSGAGSSARPGGTSRPPGKPGATTASDRHPAGAGASALPSGSSTAGTSPSAGGPSPSPTPTPSPGPTPPVLPAGYVWHRFTAATMGSTAGFKIGMPALWVQSVTGQVAHLNQAVRSFHLTVSLASWAYASPLSQAQYLQRKDARTDRDYTELSLSAAGFKAIGGFRAVPAAELKFSWRTAAGGGITELVILVTLTTQSGAQPYDFSFWAPSASFGAANGVFRTALPTFRPLPAA